MSTTILNRPLYSVSDAGEILDVPPSTLRWWLEGGVRGGHHLKPVLRARPAGESLMTWAEFVEASLLRHYRKEGLSLQKMRAFIDKARRKLKVPYPLAHYRPLIENRQLVYDLQLDVDLDPRLYLVRLTEGDQLQLAPAVEQWVKQIEWEGHIPRRFLPRGERSPIRVDPEIAYGLPQIRGIRVESLAEGVLAGESERRVADLWRATVNEVRAAVSWERSLVAA
jgi:uncharacterized protein (DUF433 family)